jgi:hypothetical protein
MTGRTDIEAGEIHHSASRWRGTINSSLGETISPDGIILRNPTTDASGVASTNPYVVGTVTLHNGQSTTSREHASAESCGDVLDARKKYRRAFDISTRCSRGDRALSPERPYEASQ